MEATKVKYTYFELFARGEPIRMALWKAGMPFEDNRVTGEAWQAFKAQKDECPYGQVPVIKLADGTVMAQTHAILDYLGTVGKLKPEDPKLVYKGF